MMLATINILEGTCILQTSCSYVLRTIFPKVGDYFNEKPLNVFSLYGRRIVCLR